MSGKGYQPEDTGEIVIPPVGGSEVEKVKYDTGATRSTGVVGMAYHLISTWGLRRLAKRYALGAVTHGARNWEDGIPVGDTIDHMIGHLMLYLQGDRIDDHMAAIAWGAFAIMHYEDTGKVACFKDILGGCVKGEDYGSI